MPVLTVGTMRKLLEGQSDDMPFAVLDDFGNAVLLGEYDVRLDYPVDRFRVVVQHSLQRTTGKEPQLCVIVVTPPTLDRLDD